MILPKFIPSVLTLYFKEYALCLENMNNFLDLSKKQMTYQVGNQILTLYKY